MIGEPAGHWNNQYQSEAPGATINRSPGLDVGGFVKAQHAMHPAEQENVLLATQNRDLPPAGNHSEHVIRHLAFLEGEVARSLPESAIDRIVAHLKRHIDAARPYRSGVRESKVHEAGKLASLLLEYSHA